LYANHTLAGSRASSVAYRAFSKLSIKEAAKKQVREVRKALKAMFKKDLIAITAQQLADHTSKQEAYQRIIEAYKTRFKRKHNGDSSLFVSDLYTNCIHYSKLDNLLKSKCPELLSAS
jgi:ribosomal protein L31E